MNSPFKLKLYAVKPTTPTPSSTGTIATIVYGYKILKESIIKTLQFQHKHRHRFILAVVSISIQHYINIRVEIYV